MMMVQMVQLYFAVFSPPEILSFSATKVFYRREVREVLDGALLL